MAERYVCCQCELDVTALVLEAWRERAVSVFALRLGPDQGVLVQCPNGHWCSYPSPSDA